MKCEYFEHIIVLSISNLASLKQKTELENHLETCESCNEYLVAQKELGKMFKVIKGADCKLENAGEISRNVMAAIEERNTISFANRIINITDHILFYLNRRVLKYGLTLASFILAFLFVVQQNNISRELKDLNSYIQQSEGKSKGRDLASFTGLKFFHKKLDLSKKKKIKLKNITPEDMENFAKDFEKLKMENEELKELLGDSLLHIYNEMKIKNINKEKSTSQEI